MTAETPRADLPREAIWVGGGVLILALSVAFGVRLGDARDARAKRDDPVLALQAEFAALQREAAASVPDLLGAGRLATAAELQQLRTRLTSLEERAATESIAVDLSEIEADFVRADFERALSDNDTDRAREVAALFAGRPLGMVLDARIVLARGERPHPEPLAVLANATDPEIADAARVLLARLLRRVNPQEALSWLTEGVHPDRVEAERTRVGLFEAVARHDAEQVEALLGRLHDAPDRDVLRRDAAAEVVSRGLRLAASRPAPVPAIEAVLRILVLLDVPALRGDADAAHLTEAIVRAAGELEEAASGPRDVERYVVLLERLAHTGLRCGDLRATWAFVDRVAAQPRGSPQREALRLRCVGAFVRLDLRLFRAHVAALDVSAFPWIPSDSVAAYLRARAELAGGGAVDAAALKALARDESLGPIHRARCFLAAGFPRRALKLDAGSPWVRIGYARALAEEGKAAEALDESEGAHVLFDRVARDRPGEADDRFRFLRELTLLHATRRDETLTEVFLRTLEKKGGPNAADVRAQADAILTRRE